MATNGNDIIFGTATDDTIDALAGHDAVFGLAGDDILIGREGRDRLNGGLDDDTLIGGDGIDTADYSSGTLKGLAYVGAMGGAGVTVDLTLSGVAQNTGGAGSDTLVSIENLTGTDFDDTLTGDSGRNELNGGAGDDTLDGGDGRDTASYATATAGVTVDISDFGGNSSGGAGNDTLESIEIVTGSPFDDEIFGGSFFGATFNGGAGNDLLVGDDGEYTLNGGANDDELRASFGSNATMNGGTGDDVLIADDFSLPGTYRMTGGKGVDTFRYQNNPFEHSSEVVITDFIGAGAAVGDQIDLRGIDANENLVSDQVFTYIGGAAFTAVGQLRYAGGILSGNTRGGLGSDFDIQLDSAPALFVSANPAFWAETDILL